MQKYHGVSIEKKFMSDRYTLSFHSMNETGEMVKTKMTGHLMEDVDAEGNKTYHFVTDKPIGEAEQQALKGLKKDLNVHAKISEEQVISGVALSKTEGFTTEILAKETSYAHVNLNTFANINDVIWKGTNVSAKLDEEAGTLTIKTGGEEYTFDVEVKKTSEFGRQKKTWITLKNPALTPEEENALKAMRTALNDLGKDTQLEMKKA